MILVLVRQGNVFDISTALRNAVGFREPETLTKETPGYNHFIPNGSSLVCTSLISGFKGNSISTSLVFLTQENILDIQLCGELQNPGDL